MSLLDRKLLRDLRALQSQALAVALVMACGLAMMIMTRSLILSLGTTRDAYYEEHRFAEVFARLKRAPHSVREQLAAIPGVAAVQTEYRHSGDAGCARPAGAGGGPDQFAAGARGAGVEPPLCAQWPAAAGPHGRRGARDWRIVRRGAWAEAGRHAGGGAERREGDLPAVGHRVVAGVCLRGAAGIGAAGQQDLRGLLDAVQGTGDGVSIVRGVQRGGDLAAPGRRSAR
jgi:hypothetical protein